MGSFRRTLTRTDAGPRATRPARRSRGTTAVAALAAGVAVAYGSLGVVLHETVGDDAVLRLPSKLVDEIPQITYGPEPAGRDASRGKSTDRGGVAAGAGGERPGRSTLARRGSGADPGGGVQATLRGLPNEQYPGG